MLPRHFYCKASTLWLTWSSTPPPYTLAAGNALVEDIVTVGLGSSGTLYQTGGDAFITSLLTIGDAGGTGKYVLTNGMLDSMQTDLGRNGGRGKLIQTGGYHGVSSTLNVGSSNSSGDYLLSGGTLDATQERIGGDDSAFLSTFIQAGGINRTNGEMAIGIAGRYDLGGGILSTGSTTVSGAASQSGGSHTTDKLTLTGSDNAIYRFSAGELNAAEVDVQTGALIQTGGQLATNNELRISSADSSQGLMRLEDGVVDSRQTTIDQGAMLQEAGKHTVAETLTVKGDVSGLTGTYQLNGGQLQTDTTRLEAAGRITQRGGEHNTNALVLTGDNDSDGKAEYQLQGSALNSQNASIQGGGLLTQTGGTHTVAQTLALSGAGDDDKHGRYQLSDGELSSSNTALNSGGEFTQDAGSHTTGNLSVTGNGAFYQLNGGTLNAHDSSLVDGGQVEQAGGEHLTEHALLVQGVVDGARSTYRLNDGVLASPETAVHTGGLIEQRGGILATNSLVASGAAADGTKSTYRLFGGDLYSQATYVEQGGEIIQSQGYHTSNLLKLAGEGEAGQARYQLDGGILSTSETVVGSRGTMSQTDGYHDTQSLDISGEQAEYQLNGGELNTPSANIHDGGLLSQSGGNLQTYLTNITGGGAFNQTGGTHNVDSTLTLSGSSTTEEGEAESGTTALYTLADGSLISATTDVTHGGAFTQTGGQHSAHNLQLKGGSYTLEGGNLSSMKSNLSAGGSLAQQGGAHDTDTLNVGTNTEAGYQWLYTPNYGWTYAYTEGRQGNGSYALSDGTLNTSTTSIGSFEGSDAQGLFQQSGGSHDTYSLYLYTTGRYELSAGSLESSWGYISGEMVQRGGNHDTYQLNLNANGSYQLNDGSLSTSYSELSSGSHFVEEGGLHKTSNLTISKGAQYELQGGVLSSYNTTVRGELHQTDGENAATSLEVRGQTYYYDPQAAGHIQLDGGLISTLSTGILGGQIDQAGGAHEVGDALRITGRDSYRDYWSGATLAYQGVYNLSGGELSSEETILDGGAFNQSGGNHNVSFALSIEGRNPSNNDNYWYNNTPGYEGSYNLSGGQLTTAGTTLTGGTFVQTGGDHIVNGDLLLRDGATYSNSYYSCGYYSCWGSYYSYKSASYALADGTLSSNNTTIGTSAGNAASVFEHNGGTHNVAGNLNIEKASLYTLNNGELTAGNTNLQGTFVQNNGHHTVGSNLNVGKTSSYTLNGGELTAANTSLQGAFVHNDGNHSAGVLNQAGTASSYTLLGGALNTQTTNISASNFLHNDGAHTADTLSVAGNYSSYRYTSSYWVNGYYSYSYVYDYYWGGYYTYTWVPGYYNSYTTYGNNGGTQADYTMAGGELNTRKTVVGGDYSNCLYTNCTTDKVENSRFTQSGGSHTTEQLDIGATGRYTLNDGALKSGTENVGGKFVQDGGSNEANALNLADNAQYVLNNGLLKASDIYVSPTALFDFNGGILAVGTFHGNLFNDGGQLSPGNSPGTTHIMGDYTQTAASSMLIEWGAGAYDQVIVDGVAKLAGKLTLSLWDNYLPSNGDSIVLLTAASILGGFDEFIAPIIEGYTFSLSYNGTSVALNVTHASEVPLPGAWAFMLSGLGLLGAARRRANQLA